MPGQRQRRIIVISNQSLQEQYNGLEKGLFRRLINKGEDLIHKGGGGGQDVMDYATGKKKFAPNLDTSNFKLPTVKVGVDPDTLHVIKMAGYGLGGAIGLFAVASLIKAFK